ncbi:MAG TPA: sugar phosphate nucleotidyltransferase [Thermoleophilaceae bacterium]
MQCLILAGGLATRLRPVTETIAKAVVPVAGRPFAEYQLEWLARAGATDVVYAIGFLGDQVRAAVGDGSRFGLAVEYVDEGEELLGTGGAVRLAYDQGVLGPAFLILYGDSYLTYDPGRAWREFKRRKPAALMTVYRNEGRLEASNAQLSEEMVVRYDKGASDPLSEGMHHIDYGLSVLDRDAVVPDIPAGQVVDLADVYTELSRQGRLAGLEVSERFYEIGSPHGLAELEALLGEGSA